MGILGVSFNFAVHDLEESLSPQSPSQFSLFSCAISTQEHLSSGQTAEQYHGMNYWPGQVSSV
jgi:hypothetical protein